MTIKVLIMNSLIKRIPGRGAQVVNAVRQYSSWEPVDVPTHTGQSFDKDDYRLARFIDKEKQVNTKFAIDLIAKVPPKKVKERVVWCDGGSGATGHPKVYINLDKPGAHSCLYCGLRFERDSHH